MAFRRTLSIRATFLARRSSPLLTYFSHHNDRSKSEEFNSSGSKMKAFLNQRSFLGYYVNYTRFTGTFCRTPYGLVGNGLSLKREMSTSSTVSEVAIAASDSAFPSAAVQYLIDAVHSFTGFNWWASIVLSVLLVRGAAIPYHIIIFRENTLKLRLLWIEVNKIKQLANQKGVENRVVAESDRRIKELLKEYNASLFTRYMEVFVSMVTSITFIIAIENMATKVPSFKTGGAMWFTDLTSPDEAFILPILTAVTFLIPSELYTRKAHVAGISMKVYARFMAALFIPISIGLPKAIFFYWITSNTFFLVFKFAMRQPSVKKALGIPDITTAPRDK